MRRLSIAAIVALAGCATEPVYEVEGECPPQGPYGTAAGEILPDVTLEDCDGNQHSLHSMCGADAAWLFVYADW